MAVITTGNHRSSTKHWTFIVGRMDRIDLWWRAFECHRLNLAQIARESISDAAGRLSPSAGASSPTAVRIEEMALRMPWDIASALGVCSPNSSGKACMQNRKPIEVEIFRAAERLRIPPPSLTRRTAPPDRDTGVKLIVRSTRTIVLTAAFALKTDITVYEPMCRKNDRNRP
jgi:hypothetical protein